MFLASPWVASFSASYLVARRPQRVLDPWARTGDLLGPVLEQNPQASAVAIESNAECAEAGQEVNRGLPIEWHHGKADQVLPQVKGTFDALVCAPPFGMHPRITANLSTEHGAVEISDDPGRIVVAQACLKLSEHGVAIVLFPPSFLWQSSPRSFRSLLGQLGLGLEAAIALPAGFLEPSPGLRPTLSR